MRIVRSLLTIGVIILTSITTTPAPAQPLDFERMCEAARREGTSALEARRARLEQAVRAAGGDAARRQEAQSELLDVLFKLKCPGLPPPTTVAVAPAPEMARRGVAPAPTTPPPPAIGAPSRPVAPVAPAPEVERKSASIPAPRVGAPPPTTGGQGAPPPIPPGEPRRFESVAPPPPPAPSTAPRTRSAAPAPAAAAPGAPAPTPVTGAVEVETFYVTNRKAKSSATPAETYGGDHEVRHHWGRVVVSIPPGHVPGAIEQPSIFKLERTADASRHFVLKSVERLDTPVAKAQVAARLRGTSTRSLLLFVHGYYVSFQDAAFRTAQLWHDLKFPGVAMFYSWPSAASAAGYWRDEDMAQICEPVFESILEEIASLDIDSVYLIAHSMGNRIVSRGMQRRIAAGGKMDKFREVLLAAPDINAEIFRNEIAPRLAALQGTRTTIYASSSDLALIASKVVHGFRRLGETSGGVFTYPGIDTIDASNAAPSARAFGHSYVVDSDKVLGDIRKILTVPAPASAANVRGLGPAGTSPETYWLLQ